MITPPHNSYIRLTHPQALTNYVRRSSICAPIDGNIGMTAIAESRGDSVV